MVFFLEKCFNDTQDDSKLGQVGCCNCDRSQPPGGCLRFWSCCCNGCCGTGACLTGNYDGAGSRAFKLQLSLFLSVFLLKMLFLPTLDVIVLAKTSRGNGPPPTSTATAAPTEGATSGTAASGTATQSASASSSSTSMAELRHGKRIAGEQVDLLHDFQTAQEDPRQVIEISAVGDKGEAGQGSSTAAGTRSRTTTSTSSAAMVQLNQQEKSSANVNMKMKQGVEQMADTPTKAAGMKTAKKVVQEVDTTGQGQGKIKDAAAAQEDGEKGAALQGDELKAELQEVEADAAEAFDETNFTGLTILVVARTVVYQMQICLGLEEGKFVTRINVIVNLSCMTATSSYQFWVQGEREFFLVQRRHDEDVIEQSVMLGPAFQTSWGFESLHDDPCTHLPQEDPDIFAVDTVDGIAILVEIMSLIHLFTWDAKTYQSKNSAVVGPPTTV
ncbi:unnamed protein product [Amoebophrya sp. A120]|nr:unnamed protein product [Amoebophrya sp. A120]|eukprot:GSA120T00000604001.1